MRTFIASSLLLVVAAPVLFAHPGHGETGVAVGLAHPLMGVDHLLAMVAVGLLGVRCAQQPGNNRHALWQVPASFLAAMIGGGLLAVAGLPMPLAEWGIAMSVLIFGVLIALVQAPRTWIACTVAGVFALMHGHAHVAEMSGSNIIAYMGGFLAMTAALHAAGVAAGWWLAKAWQQTAVRALGVGAALASIGLFAGLFASVAG